MYDFISQCISLFLMCVGAVYNVKFPKSVGIGFNCDNRKDPGGNSVTAEADMYIPKADYGPAITIAKKITVKKTSDGNPGAFSAIYHGIKRISTQIHQFIYNQAQYTMF